MKISSLILIAGFVFLQSAGAHAAGIHQREYRYSFGDMALDNARTLTFVICDDACAPPPPLLPAPRFPVLSIRVSQNPAASANKGAAQRPPVSENSETAVSEGKSHKQQDPDARITLFFRLDSSTLSHEEKAKLASFIEGLDAETKAGNLFVTGYTCDLGSKAHNDVLAMKRAEAVEAYLRKAGLRAIWMTGTGKCCYQTKDPGKQYLNRRAEVIIGKREVAK